MTKKYLAIIPARGGSKRLPRKNLLKLKGKPLISHTIEEALKSKYLDKVIISSDDEDILTVGRKYDVEVLKRPSRLATDDSSSIDVIEYILKFFTDYEYLVLLQPTSPLRKVKHIDESIELLERLNANSIISVCEMEHSPLWSNILPSDNNMDNFLEDSIQGKRSQDLEKYYRINGAIYICKISKFLEEKKLFLKDKTYAYKMDRKNSIDIDEEIDFKIAEFLLS